MVAGAAGFACHGTCGADFLKGLQDHFSSSEKTAACNDGSPVRLDLERSATECIATVRVDQRPVHVITTSFETPEQAADPGLEDAAGRNTALALVLARAAWRSADRQSRPSRAAGANAAEPRPPKKEEARRARTLAPEPPPRKKSPAYYALISPALPWWVDRPTPARRALLATDGAIVGLTVLGGAFTILARDKAEKDTGARPFADAGYMVTLTGASIAVLGRLVAAVARWVPSDDSETKQETSR
jgi:hypothetical protein